MTERQEIKHLHSLLKHKNKWYIDVYSPDIDEMMSAVMKAKKKADKSLSNMWFITMWYYYNRWVKSDKIISPKEDYYISFLNDLIYVLGLRGIKGRERDLFCDNCCLTVKFI